MSTSGYRSVCLSVRPFLSRLSIHLSVLAAFINLLSLKSLHLPSEKNKRPLDCRPVRTRIKTQTAHTHSPTHTQAYSTAHRRTDLCRSVISGDISARLQSASKEFQMVRANSRKQPSKKPAREQRRAAARATQRVCYHLKYVSVVSGILSGTIV